MGLDDIPAYGSLTASLIVSVQLSLKLISVLMLDLPDKNWIKSTSRAFAQNISVIGAGLLFKTVFFLNI